MLPASFAANTLSVRARNGSRLLADFASGALHWRGATPVAEGNVTWRPLPSIERDAERGQVVAVGLKERSFGRAQVEAFVEALPSGAKNISMASRLEVRGGYTYAMI